MKKLLLLTAFALSIGIAPQAANIETYSITLENEDLTNAVLEIPQERPINGGTIIIPEFDESCPEEMKEPFRYACKLLEDFIPPCLPIHVKVSCGRVNSSGEGPTLSKVTYIIKEECYALKGGGSSPLTGLKGALLDGWCKGTTGFYYDYIPDLDFLIGKPDITVTYNSERLDEFSFSIDAAPEDKYDFVSVALRDMLRGMGISSRFRYNPQTNGLEYPMQMITPFEWAIKEALGNGDDPQARLERATRGELTLPTYSSFDVKLYAPTTWMQEISLNYLIPNPDNALSHVLTYNFGKGSVTRTLDDYSGEFIFRNLLKWNAAVLAGAGSSSGSTSGHSRYKVPYKGTFNLEPDAIYDQERYSIPIMNLAINAPSEITPPPEKLSLYNYVNQFGPFQPPFGDKKQEGLEISVLKTDGTWDQVHYIPFIDAGPLHLDMNEWTFNYPNEDYARTADGFLKARVTQSERNIHRGFDYTSTFILLDYLPQRVGLSYIIPETSAALPEANSTQATAMCPVRIFFSNFGGLDRIILERLREGSRLPSKIIVNDFKKGYIDLTIDRNTTFTAVGYNANGYTRSLPISVSYDVERPAQTSALSISHDSSTLRIDRTSEDPLDYTVVSISQISSQAVLTGQTKSNIDISGLPEGLYIITLYDETGQKHAVYKFKK